MYMHSLSLISNMKSSLIKMFVSYVLLCEYIFTINCLINTIHTVVYNTVHKLHVLQALMMHLRRGYCYMEFDRVVGGVYNVMLSTFRPGEEGPFLLNVCSSRPVTVARIQ